MNITIPKKIMKNDDLVILPRREYENLLRAKKSEEVVIKRSPSFKIKKGQEKFYDQLDKDLTQSVREYKAGKFAGPFSTVADFRRHIERKK